MKRVLIIGGTGNVGREVVAQLAAQISTGAGQISKGSAQNDTAAVRIRAMVRKPEIAELPEQVEIVQGDLTLPESLDECLADIETVFLVWAAPAEAVRGAIERIARRARRVVLVSAPLKTPHPFFQQPNALRALMELVERTIESSGLEWTYLRPGMFALNARHFWGPAIRGGEVVRWPYLDCPTAPIDERDIAGVAVRVLCEEGHGGKEYVLTGPESLSQRAQIETIGRVIGRAVPIEEMPADEARRTGIAGMPPAVAGKLLDAWAAGLGQPAVVTTAVREVTRVDARRFDAWVAANAGVFGGVNAESPRRKSCAS